MHSKIYSKELCIAVMKMAQRKNRQINMKKKLRRRRTEKKDEGEDQDEEEREDNKDEKEYKGEEKEKEEMSNTCICKNNRRMQYLEPLYLGSTQVLANVKISVKDVLKLLKKELILELFSLILTMSTPKDMLQK